jgi:hypothetical protein
MAGKIVTPGEIRVPMNESVCHMYRLAIKEEEYADRKTLNNSSAILLTANGSKFRFRQSEL